MLYINCISMKLEKKCLSSKCECSCPLPLRNSKPPVALGLSQRSCTFGSAPLHTAPSPWASPAAPSLLGWCALSASLERLPQSPVVQMLLPLRPAIVTATLRSAPVKSGSWHWGRFRGTPNPTEDRTSPLANLCSLPSILRMSPSEEAPQLLTSWDPGRPLLSTFVSRLALRRRQTPCRSWWGAVLYRKCWEYKITEPIPTSSFFLINLAHRHRKKMKLSSPLGRRLWVSPRNH